MSGYSSVSIISIFCYAFLLLTFAFSKEKVKVLRSFMLLMLIMIFWTGGSIAMRLQLLGFVNVWHHMSLLGSMMLTFGYYQFVQDFLGEKRNYLNYVMGFGFLALFLFNAVTNFFVPLPEVVVKANGQTQFLYHYTWRVYPFFGLVFLGLGPTFTMAWRHCRGNHFAFQQLLPVIQGIAAIVIGHLLAVFPMFTGFPVDMLSGAVNAVFIFYALYKKKLFRMTILLSKTNYVIIASTLGVIIFSNATMHFRRIMLNLQMDYTLIMVSSLFFLVGMITVLYLFISKSFNWVFIRPEEKKQEMLNQFSEEITHMMNVNEILMKLADIVQTAVDPSRFYVLIRGRDGNFRIEHTISPLDEKNFLFRADHPIVAYLNRNRHPVLYQDFTRNTIYRSMWESEKALLVNQQIECFIPLISENNVAGFLMLSGKPKKPVTTAPVMAFLQNAADICANAVSNAYTYEKAIEEAQQDSLTGLLNYKFFFEILDREFERCKDTALSLCLINIDDFKRYNQLYGAREGDAALRNVAGILSSSIGEYSYAARINGDEFAVILPGYDVYSAKCLADNISDQINTIRTSFDQSASGRLTVSIGICAAPYMASSAKELYRNAESTVYTVKRTGKNAVQTYSVDILQREPSVNLHKSGYSEHASTIYALTAAIDAKDHYTFQHSQNVAYYAAELAKAANMTPDLVEIVHEAGLLHDIGKIGIPEDILNKPAKLSSEEFETMKSHVNNAVNIIRHLPSLDYVIPAVKSHHERYDGKGYPNRLVGDNIPFTGRILSIADAFDAITTKRSYKKSIPVDKALTILRGEAGKQFDPNLVELFAELVESGKMALRTAPSETAEATQTDPAALLASVL